MANAAKLLIIFGVVITILAFMGEKEVSAAPAPVPEPCGDDMPKHKVKPKKPEPEPCDDDMPKHKFKGKPKKLEKAEPCDDDMPKHKPKKEFYKKSKKMEKDFC